jgi:polyhydroxyalkanoate synthesis regulator phasin
MNEEARGNEETNRAGEKGGPRSAGLGDGIRQGIGVLSAFKDAIEETIQEARDRGDLSAERAREVMKDALGKAQTAAGEARERLDFAQQGDLDDLRAAMGSILDRVAALEVHVFGAERGREGGAASTGSGVGEDAPGGAQGDVDAGSAPEEPGAGA